MHTAKPTASKQLTLAGQQCIATHKRRHTEHEAKKSKRQAEPARDPQFRTVSHEQSSGRVPSYLSVNGRLATEL